MQSEYHITKVTDTDNDSSLTPMYAPMYGNAKYMEGRYYHESIPMESNRGLITIHNSDCHSHVSQKVDLVIERHPQQRVEIIAFISRPEVLKIDPSHPETQHSDGKLYYKKGNMLWKPFRTDVIEDRKARPFTKEPRLDKLRGGNRLTINLTVQQYFYNTNLDVIRYVVRIPDDADLYVDLPVGDISYTTPPACKRILPLRTRWRHNLVQSVIV